MRTIVNFYDFKEVMHKLKLSGGNVSIENISVETLNGQNINYYDDFNIYYYLDSRGFNGLYLIEDVYDSLFNEDTEEFEYTKIYSNEYDIYTINCFLDDSLKVKKSYESNYKNKLYSINDLFGNGKYKAIYEIIIDWVCNRVYNLNKKGCFELAIDKSKEEYSEEFICEYIYEYCLDEIIQFANTNNYLYDEDGNRIL